MCDSCIVQLNVAYNMKKNAIQSDIKLRQYMIEFGINMTSYTTCSINTVSVIRPPAMILPSTTTTGSVTITTTEKSTTVVPPAVSQTRRFPVMPVVIKEEPVDYDVMSDITVETSNGFEDNIRNQRSRINGIESAASTSSASNQSITSLPRHSMVAVNTNSLLIRPETSTDSEYLSTYMTPNANITKPVSKQTTVNSFISIATTKAKKLQASQTTNKSPTKRTPPKAAPKSKQHLVHSAEERYPKRQKQKEDTENTPTSRLRSTTTPGKDYTSFFRLMPNRTDTPNTSPQRKVRFSPKTETAIKPKQTAIRTRRMSVANNRSSI